MLSSLSYWWRVFSLYVNLKHMVYQSLILFVVIGGLAWGWQDYWMLIGIPFWLFFSFLSLYVLWRTRVKPEQKAILKEIELEGKYPFFYGRFTQSKE